MTSVPDSLPTISHGGHAPNDGEACVMEYVSVITGSRWTDDPTCTNPVLAAVARAVNDQCFTSDAERAAAMVPLIGRLMGAGDTSEKTGLALLEVLSSRGHNLIVNWAEYMPHEWVISPEGRRCWVVKDTIWPHSDGRHLSTDDKCMVFIQELYRAECLDYDTLVALLDAYEAVNGTPDPIQIEQITEAATIIRAAANA